MPQIVADSEGGSLLSRGLAAVKSGGLQQAPASRQRDDTYSDVESLMSDPRVDHNVESGTTGCTVSRPDGVRTAIATTVGNDFLLLSGVFRCGLVTWQWIGLQHVSHLISAC